MSVKVRIAEDGTLSATIRPPKGLGLVRKHVYAGDKAKLLAEVEMAMTTIAEQRRAHKKLIDESELV